MKWNMKELRRPRPSTRRQPIRKSRPLVERLETRLAPANVDVLTYHNDALLGGSNTHEEILTPANVNVNSFGKLFTQAVDGYVYAAPLYKAQLAIPGQGTHDVAFIATEHDSVYAFDANTGTQLWQRSFLGTNIATMPSGETGSGDIVPEIGITGTPVIDGTTGTMYVTAKTKETRADGNHYVFKVHAINITNGLDRATNPEVTISDTLGTDDNANNITTNVTWPGDGAGSLNHVIRFNARREHHRAATTILGNNVYITFASHGDNGPYHGWIVGYQMSNLSLQKVFNTSANARAAGIWQSGGGLATDGTNLFFATGNTFSGPQPGFSPANGNYGETVLKVDTTGAGQAMTVRDYFTPFNWQALDNGDTDLGSGGTMLLPDYVGSAAHQHLMVELGKQGKIYLIDRGNATDTNTMGHVNNPPSGPDLVVQTVTAGQAGVWGNPSFLQTSPTEGIIYYHGSGDVARGYHITNGHIDDVNVLHSGTSFGFPGGQPIESSNGVNVSTGIAWDLKVDNYSGTGPATLFAYRADNLATLYTSNDAGQADQFGASVKFIAATQTNGHVLVGARGTFSVFGLFPSHATAPAARTALSGMALPGGTQITLQWTNPDTLANRIRIERSLNMSTGFTQVGIVGGTATTFTDTGLTPATHYFYRVRASNDQGDSPNSTTIPVDSRIGIPVLAVTHISSGQIDLSWTASGNAGYRLDRQFNGGAFSTIFTTGDPTRTTYTDTDPMLLAQRGTYTYRVTAMNTNPTDSADSNLASGANMIQPINHMAGFADPPVGPGHADLTANGDSQFAEGFARLTQAINGQNGTIFANQRVGVSTFDTTFQYRIHEGSDPRADGATFTIQTNSATTLGIGGGGLGYGPDHTGSGRGIRNSLAVKFNFYTGAEGGGNNTGVFTDGRAPTIRDPGLPPTPTPEIPDINVNLAGTGVDLNNQSPKLIRLTYNGTILSERIEDTVSHAVFTHDYAVNLQAIIGSDTAWVGFTGATGGLNAVQDVQTWIFNPGVTAPAAPDLLAVTSPSGANAVDLLWRSNSVNETGFVIERSHDNVNFVQVGSVGVAVQTFHDGVVPQGLFFYRVRAVNAQGASSASGTVRANVGRAAILVDHSQGFATHTDLQANGAVTFPAPLGSLFADQDIGTGGNPTAAGNATFASGPGTYTVQASGSDIWDTADHFHYAYRPLTGDGEVVARLASITNQDFWTKGGLMIRDNLTAGSPNAFMFGTSSPDHEEPVFQWRDSQNGGSADFGNHINHLQAAPVWLRLTRTGNSFSGFWAHDNGDGTHGDWNQIGSAHTVPGMGTSVYIGLALTEHNNQAQLATATYDHVTITQAGAPLPVATIARITDGGNGEASSLWKTQQVPVTGSFTTSFNLRELPVNIGGADGLAFALQADPRGAGALGGGGGAIGYEGITHSIAVEFNIWDNNSHNPHHTLTTLFRNGVIDRSAEIDMNSAGINLLSNDPMRVDLSYDGITKVLTETVRDLKTAATFSTNYNVDLRGTIGSDMAYAGFTGGTGGASAVQDVTNWTSDFEPFPNPALVITRLSPTVTAGDPQGFLLSVMKGDGTPYTDYRGTVHIGSSDLQASLPRDYTFTAADQGSHVFGYVLRTAGPQSITIADAANGFSDDANTSVVAAPASFLFITNPFPSPTLSGAPGNITLTAYDAYFNVATGYTGTVTVTSSDNAATLPSPYHFTTGTGGDNGTHTFSATLRTLGSQSITVTDDSLPTHFTDTQTDIQVTAARFVVAGFPNPTTAGTPGTFTVTALDANGNTATGYRGTVTFSSSDLQAELPDPYTFTEADHGTHIFGGILKTAGTQSITAADADVDGLSGTQGGIVVNPSPIAGYFTVTGFPSPIRAGTPGMFVVHVFDAYGNAAPGYRGQVAFSSTDGQAEFADPYTFTAEDGGVHTFMGGVLKTAGPQSVIVTDTDNGASGEQDGIVVTPSVAASFRVSGYPSPTIAGQVHTFTVTAVDAYGNDNAIYNGTIRFSSSDLAANLPADSPLGQGTFAAAFNTVGTQSLTATDLGDPSITGTQSGIEVVGPSIPTDGAFLVGALAPASAAPTSTVSAAAATIPALTVSASNVVTAPITPVRGNDQQLAAPGLKQDLAGQAATSADAIGLALGDWSNAMYAPVTDDLIRARMA